MRDTIYTIPISEVFDPKQGCPICRMRDMLEERAVEYIMGAAMMEPDVRQETNKVGFCTEHFRMMLPRKNRLSIALMLQSHLDFIRTEIVDAKAPMIGKDRRMTRAKEIDNGCFVCGRIHQSMERMLDNMMKVWEREESFRQLFDEQEYICFPHYVELMEVAQAKLSKKLFPAFSESLGRLTLNRLMEMKAGIDEFCNLFDYRSAHSGAVSDEVKLSLEHSVQFLTGRSME